MGKPHPMALRERVVALVEEGHSHRAAATVNGRYNPDVRQRYQIIIQAGKPPKFALTALMRKMIELANAFLQQDRKWTPKTA